MEAQGIDESQGDGVVLPFLSYTSTGSPLGDLWLAATRQGICLLRFGLTEEEWVAALSGETGAMAQRAPGHLAEACQQLAQYFGGDRRSFDLGLDLRRGSAFQHEVWAATSRIPYGQVRTYGDIARAIGAPGAARAVGGALGANPVPIFVPCHRVVRADGGLGGYREGVEIKRALLRLEGCA